MDSPFPQPAPPPRAAILLFCGMAFTFPLAGGLAQLANVSFGLLWTEIFLFFGPAWLLVRAFRGHPADWLRLSHVSPRAIVLGLLCGLANYPLTAALEAVVRQFVEVRWPHFAKQFDIAGATLGSVHGWQQAVLLLAVGFVAPLCEETAFRGLIQRSLARRLRPGAAIAIAAALFGFIHYEPIGFLARTELGLLFGFLVLWTDSLWASIAAHAANNLFASALYFFASDAGGDPKAPPLQLLGLALVGFALTTPLLYVASRTKRPTEEPEWTPPGAPAETILGWGAVAAVSWLVLLAVGYLSGGFASQIAR